MAKKKDKAKTNSQEKVIAIFVIPLFVHASFLDIFIASITEIEISHPIDPKEQPRNKFKYTSIFEKLKDDGLHD